MKPILEKKNKELRCQALLLLAEKKLCKKINGIIELSSEHLNNKLIVQNSKILKNKKFIPGRPVKPVLVSPGRLVKRSMKTVEGRMSLIHSLAHIEFNAINLALDIIWRFPNLPFDFYFDWLQVALEEARHFTLLNTYLSKNKHEYGNFPAHNGLWEMAEKTKNDLLARLAIIPKTLEARGLDISPLIIKKLEQAKDINAAQILKVILKDEIKHVALGNKWFNWICEQKNLDKQKTYINLIKQYSSKIIKFPLNENARLMAGFSDDEINSIKSLAKDNS